MKKTLKRNWLAFFIVIIFIGISTLYYNFTVITASKMNGYTIVIDAGHGGLDVK